MKVIIIDDEPIAIEILSTMLGTYEDIEILSTYTNPLDAMEDIKSLEVDAVFLDIEMPSINGIEFAAILNNRQASIEIVFITAYSQYALDAFEVNAIDYLLKPIQEKRLDACIERLRLNIEHSSILAELASKKDRLVIVKSLGDYFVQNTKGEILQWRTRKAKELFAYLLAQRGKVVSKALIAEDVFTEKLADESFSIIHTTIYQLRKSLRNLGFEGSISYFNDGYKLSLACKSDLDELGILLDKQNHSIDEIEEILGLYKGDFLEKEGYQWSIQIQNRYRNRVFRALKAFVEKRQEDSKDNPIIESCLSKIHELEPYNEELKQMLFTYFKEI